MRHMHYTCSTPGQQIHWVNFVTEQIMVAHQEACGAKQHAGPYSQVAAGMIHLACRSYKAIDQMQLPWPLCPAATTVHCSAVPTTAGMWSKVFPFGWSSGSSDVFGTCAATKKRGWCMKHDTAHSNYIMNIALPDLCLGILPEQKDLECIQLPGPAEIKGTDEVCHIHCPRLPIMRLLWASRNRWTCGRRCMHMTSAPSWCC